MHSKEHKSHSRPDGGSNAPKTLFANRHELEETMVDFYTVKPNNTEAEVRLGH